MLIGSTRQSQTWNLHLHIIYIYLFISVSKETTSENMLYVQYIISHKPHIIPVDVKSKHFHMNQHQRDLRRSSALNSALKKEWGIWHRTNTHRLMFSLSLSLNAAGLNVFLHLTICLLASQIRIDPDRTRTPALGQRSLWFLQQMFECWKRKKTNVIKAVRESPADTQPFDLDVVCESDGIDKTQQWL